MAAGSAAIFISSRMSPAAFTMHTLTVCRDTSRPAKLLHFPLLGLPYRVPGYSSWHDRPLTPSLPARSGRQGSRSLDVLKEPACGRFRRRRAPICCVTMLESVVQRCMAEGLVGADGFAVDASLIAADANKQRSVSSKDWKPEEIKETATRAAQEYLATLDDAAFGAASPVTPKFISRSDPAAQWTGANKVHAFFAYAANYLIDTNHGVIVDVEATRAIRQAEVGAARTMLERTETRFGIKPVSLTADSAYGSADSLAWLVKEKDIAPHIPLFDKSNRTDGTFSRADFAFDAERDRYTCPARQRACPIPTHLQHIPRSGVTAEGTRLYRASKS